MHRGSMFVFKVLPKYTEFIDKNLVTEVVFTRIVNFLIEINLD
jgi:hypothetical protein